MPKALSTALAVALLVLSANGHHELAMAGSCVAATSCGSLPIQFVPGQRITVELVNLTESVVQVQQVNGTDPLSISPGQTRSFVRGGSTDPNFSVVFWDANGLPLKLNLLKPEARILRLEVRPGDRPPGDRTVYLKDDGRIAVF